MPPEPFQPPAKYSAIRDFIPCISSYGGIVCAYHYPTVELRDQAIAAMVLLGINTTDPAVMCVGKVEDKDEKVIYRYTEALK